ncbi:extracellular catalytic domain type 1 short-chain-length polyhydroxyalkanoate depolymerase [Rhizobium populisoli]|uniref:extracellular catalytic domain type 1 short-chain-length polyhydroxyalkanoate depolymerase n=1 Tax=Rhizobium populisoli TaxID=2859785 RepID=UPI0035E40CB0
MRQMIDTVVKRCGISPTRIFVTGLSAGGVMANVMLATYPEIFAGGAIIAGLPYGIADSVPEAFDRMRDHGIPPAAHLQGILRSTIRNKGPWPTITVLHGSRDNTVVPANGEAVAAQWHGVHGIHAAASTVVVIDGHTVTSWRDTEGRVAVEHISIAGMAHGTPLDIHDGYGRSGPYRLDARFSSTVYFARDWGLTPSFEKRHEPSRTPAHQTLDASTAPNSIRGSPMRRASSSGSASTRTITPFTRKQAG